MMPEPAIQSPSSLERELQSLVVHAPAFVYHHVPLYE
jgi:hypothetical protein